MVCGLGEIGRLMAKSEERAAAAARAAGELKKELRRLVLAITDDDDVRSETFEEAAKVLAALREMKSSGKGNNFGKRSSSSPLSSNEKDHRSEVQVPEHFLCPISSEIMKDPVIVASGQVVMLFILDLICLKLGLNSI